MVMTVKTRLSGDGEQPNAVEAGVWLRPRPRGIVRTRIHALVDEVGAPIAAFEGLAVAGDDPHARAVEEAGRFGALAELSEQAVRLPRETRAQKEPLIVAILEHCHS